MRVAQDRSKKPSDRKPQDKKTPVKSKNQNPFLVAAISLLLTAPSAFAAALTWDTTSGDGATITPGIGNWNTTAGNLVWNNAGANPNVIWSQ